MWASFAVYKSLPAGPASATRWFQHARSDAAKVSGKLVPVRLGQTLCMPPKLSWSDARAGAEHWAAPATQYEGAVQRSVGSMARHSTVVASKAS